MRINTNEKSGNARQVEVGKTVDAYTKSIQKQIENAQKQLEKLSSNTEMSMEE